MQSLNSTIEILLARFGGQVLIPFIVGAECVGFPQQTARNKLSKGKFPIQTVVSGSRRFIHIQDLAAYVESLRGGVPCKRGAKTKKERIEAQQAQGIVR